MPSKTKPSKLPTRRVVADDLVIEVDGVSYYPHAGESVTFRVRRQTIDDHLLQLRLVALQQEITKAADAGTLDVGPVAQLEDLASRAYEQLCGAIAAWEWTDDDNNPLQAPSIGIIRTLGKEEIEWLRRHAFPEATEAERKNGLAPSA